jgi:hypothetical protein
MDSNSNNFSSLLKSNGNTNVDMTPITSTSSSESFFSGIQNMGIMTWVIIILILAFLGFNIFVYLAKGTNFINSFFTPIITKIVELFALVTGKIVDVTAEGTKTIVNASASTIDQGLSSVQDVAQKVQVKPSQPNLGSNKIQQQPPDIMANNALNQSLNTSAQRQSQNNDYQADESTSTIQSGGGKSGWCYIGEDRGFRSCVEVGQNDTCMSGDIFPSNEICVNPNLRA